MNPHVSFDLHIIPPEKTFISAISSAALYGKGVFTSVAIYDSNPFLWEKHWRRLQESAGKIGIDLQDFDEEFVQNALQQLIRKNELETGRARLTFFDAAAGKIWDFPAKNKTSLLITTAGFRPLKAEFSLTVAPFPVNSRSPLAGLKSCNYLENLLALDEAAKRGFDEAIRLNERDEIVSASIANIFWVKNEKVYTPALETGCLAGTLRAFLLENFEVAETKSALEELSKADEIFLTSSGIGVRPARFGDEEKKLFPTTTKFSKFLDLQRFKA